MIKTVFKKRDREEEVAKARKALRYLDPHIRRGDIYTCWRSNECAIELGNFKACMYRSLLNPHQLFHVTEVIHGEEPLSLWEDIQFLGLSYTYHGHEPLKDQPWYQDYRHRLRLADDLDRKTHEIEITVFV